MSAQAQPMIATGGRRLVDHLDTAYAAEYLDRRTPSPRPTAAPAARAAGHGFAFTAAAAGHGFAFTAAAAKYLAGAMAYDDLTRAADLKLRTARLARSRPKVDADDGALVTTTEYFHPRVAELRKVVDRGRRTSPNIISGHLMLALVTGRGPKRRASLRHGREVAHIDAWEPTARAALGSRYELGVAVLGARGLVKGYSETHAHGLLKFDRLLCAAPALMGRDDGAVSLDRLTRAAPADEKGGALDGVLLTVASR
jgi:indolepyruvate ferredoxin oxidoreductase beta subunit